MSWAFKQGATGMWPLGRYSPYPKLTLGTKPICSSKSERPLASSASCPPPTRSLPVFPPESFGPLAKGMAGAGDLATPPQLDSCEHVRTCVDMLDRQFLSTMSVTAKCGECSASASESSLWVCVMPNCYVAGCFDPCAFDDHMKLHYDLNPSHHIQVDVKTGYAHCNKCIKMVNISSRLKHREGVDVRALASLKLPEHDEMMYSNLTEASLNSDERERTRALNILAANRGLGKMMPRLIMFIRDRVTACESNQKLYHMVYLMEMTRALASNPNLSFEEAYLKELMNATGTCIVTTSFCNVSEVTNQLYLRDLASGLMADFCQVGCNRGIHEKVVLKKFLSFLKNETLPLATHYGVIATLQRLGPEYILPYIQSLSRKIDWGLKGSHIERVTALKTRDLLIKAVSPVVKNIRNPNWNQFGSIGPYLKEDGVVNVEPRPLFVNSNKNVREDQPTSITTNEQNGGNKQLVDSAPKSTQPNKPFPGKLSQITDFSVKSYLGETPYQIKKSLVNQKLIDSINAKPYDYTRLMVTVPDIISNFCPDTTVEKCRSVLQDVVKLTLYKGNVLQGQVLQSEGKCASFDPVPLVEVYDLIKNMETILNNLSVTKAPGSVALVQVDNQLDKNRQIVQQPSVSNHHQQPSVSNHHQQSSVSNLHQQSSVSNLRPNDAGDGRERPNEGSSSSVSSVNASSMTDPGLDGEVHVYGLKNWWDETIIRHQFRGAGTILGVYLTKTDHAYTYCHIRFSSTEEAKKCIEEVNGQRILGRKMQVSWAKVAKCINSHPYYIYCENHNICFNFNVSDNGCSRKKCPLRHICLYCHELTGMEDSHSSRFACPEQREEYVKYPLRDSPPQPSSSN